MRSLDRRLRRLEATRCPDPSGLRPRSEEWSAYWDHQFERFCAGERDVHLTLEGVRAAMQHAEDGDFIGGVN
jgi:hypothetical protein